MLQRDLLRARRSNTPAGSCSLSSIPSAASMPASFFNTNGTLMPLPSNQLFYATEPQHPNCSFGSTRQSRTVLPSSTPSTPGLLDEAVSVAVRCRPPNASQGERADDVIVSMDPSRKEIYVRGEDKYTWYVDLPVWSCVGPAKDRSACVSQAELYESVGRPLLLHALEGYNSTLIAYGPTGSGKTYTMMGGRSACDTVECEDDGIIPRMCRHLFKHISDHSFMATRGESISWEVHLRYVEVYCEKVSDLFNFNAPVGVREEVTPKSANFVLTGARRLKATCTEDVLQALRAGNKCRHTAATKFNEHSSRSHALFMIELTEVLSFTEPDGTVMSAPSKSLTIRLLDLAGSERVSETGVVGQQLKEAREINVSLFALGQVIECLTDGKRRGIKPPYRDSILTKLLRDAFGGNSKTTMICTIAPSEAFRQQTIQTLHYAAKARRVVNKPRVQQDPQAIELRRANEELFHLRKELCEARRNGIRSDEIERQLSEANERLLRDQEETRRRRQAVEEQEARLAERLRQMEEQREAFELQMESLEAVSEQAKHQQTERERELRRAHRTAEEQSKLRMEELRKQWEVSESSLKAKEAELLVRQREVETKMRALEEESKQRVDELLRRQRDLECEVKEKEALIKVHEDNLRRQQLVADDEVRKLGNKTRELEEEWMGKLHLLEQDAKRREEEMCLRAEEAQKRLRAKEDEAYRKGEEMRMRWSEADQQARLLQAEMEAKENELDGRVLELHRQAQEREMELSDRLQTAQFELQRRDREFQQHQVEVESLRQTVARQSESNDDKVRNIENKKSLFEEGARRREELLCKREKDLDEQFKELVRVKREWDRQHLAKQSSLDEANEVTQAHLRAKEKLLQQREDEHRRLSDASDAEMRAKEMELRRMELELSAQRIECEAQAQRNQHIHVHTKDGLQRAAERVKLDEKLYRERLQRWETDLHQRRSTMERMAAEREAALSERERALLLTKDQLVCKDVELDQLAHKLQMEREELARQVDELNHRGESPGKSVSQNSQLDVRVDHTRRLHSVEVGGKPKNARKGSTAPDAEAALQAACEAMFRREMADLTSCESLCRAYIQSETNLQFRYLVLSSQLQQREVHMAAQSEHLRKAQATAEATALELQSAEEREAGWRSQVTRLQEEVDRRDQELAEAQAKCSTVTATSKRSEATLETLRQVMAENNAAHREALGEVTARMETLQKEVLAARQATSSAMRTTQLLQVGMEERERSLLENHDNRDRMLTKLLEFSERKSLAKNEALARWQALYKRQDVHDRRVAGADQQAPLAEVHGLMNFARKEDDLRKYEEALLAEQGRLQQRILDFEAHKRSREYELERQEHRVKCYLLELEEMDRKKMAEFAEREKRLVEEVMRVKEKEEAFTRHVHEACSSIMMRSAEDQSELFLAHEELERDSLHRIAALTKERDLCVHALRGDVRCMETLLRDKEAALVAEAERLQERQRKLEETEARRKERVAMEEQAIRNYLLFLEQDDIRRAELSKQGQDFLMQAEKRLEQVRRREEALREMGRRLSEEARHREEEADVAVSQLKEDEENMNRQMKERTDHIARRQEEVSTLAENNERTLLELETNLQIVISRNRDAEHAIQLRDAELQRQKRYYLDLSELLKERERLLRLEHAHRMDGKDSATWLTDDLLDVNDVLRKKLTTMKRQLDVLRAENKLECERCSWKNTRESEICRCCGDGLLHDGLKDVLETPLARRRAC